MAFGLKQFAEADADRLMISDEQTSLTRAQFNDRVNRLINLMREHDLNVGDAAAIMAHNCTDFMTIACACGLSGVSLVPVNWHFKEDEAAYIIRQGNAKAIFVDAANHDVAAAAANLIGCRTIFEMGERLDDQLAQCLPDELSEEPFYASPVFFTSGTTGRPKATRLSQTPTNVPVSAALKKIQENALLSGFSDSFVHLVQGPLYHAGPIGNATPALLQGGPIYVMPRFDPEEALRFIETYKITHSMMVPIMFVRLLKLPKSVREKYDVSSLQIVSHIAAPMPPLVKREMIEWWGPKLIDAYGASEIGVITRITSDEWLKKPGSVGRPIPQFTIRIIDDDDQILATGEVGQIYMLSHTDVDLEYIGDPDRTAAAHRGKKEFTLGDMGWLDNDGYLFLADRRVDMINSGGVKIYPAEIESAMHNHPAIEDVAVFGIPNAEWGQEVKAAVRLLVGGKANAETSRDIVEWLKGRIANYKIPKSIDFHDELPRYSNGKLHRRVLRDAYWANENSGAVSRLSEKGKRE
jgi:long-chain acyl-CoA synthetase